MKDDELGMVYSDGEVIFEEGDAADRMYVLQSGRVRITKKTASGDVTVATLDSGEILGEMALFDRLPRSATALAVGEARILSIDKKKLFQTLSRDPTLVFKIIESMSRRIRSLDEEFTKLRKNKLDLQIFADVEEICKFIMKELRHFINAENGSVMLIDHEDRKLSVKTAFGTEWEPKMRLGPGEGIAGNVMETGKSELINDVLMDPRYRSGIAPIKSILCVPLRGKIAKYGVINMSRTSTELFTLEDLKLLRSIAIYASVAIENAMNFAKLSHAADEILSHAAILDMWHEDLRTSSG